MFKFKIRFLFVCFFSIPTLFYSQDRIVTKTGENIECRILTVDSIRITYRLRNQSPRHEIFMNEVENYYLSKVTASEIEYLNRPEKEFFSLVFAGGISYPLGDFASMDASSELSGLAFKGYQFSGTLLFKLSDYISLDASYLSQRHALNYQTVSNYNNTYFGTNNFTSDGGDWLITGVFIGLQGDFPLKIHEGLSLYGNLLFGVPKFYFPEQVTKGSIYGPNTSPVTINLSESTTSSACFQIGLGLRYKLSKNFALNISSIYLTAKPTFFDIYLSASNGYSEYFNYTQKIQTISIQGGLSFIFNKK